MTPTPTPPCWGEKERKKERNSNRERNGDVNENTKELISYTRLVVPAISVYS